MPSAAAVLPKNKGPLSEQIDQWALSVLQPYFSRRAAPLGKASKQFHDPVAQTILLSAGESYLVDSPIMQRLRYIRQLGVGHYLFPSSGYSRFEHSIGALHSASHIYDSVMTAAAPPFPKDEVDALRSVVRVAALFHDVGHCVFSHVSERFYADQPEMKETMELLAKFYVNKVSASEAISVLIVLSPAMHDLVTRSTVCPKTWTTEEFLGTVACCIAGARNRLIPHAFLAEMVNGVVDADKLDYLARDARTAGVPISLDVERLYAKLRLSEELTKKGRKNYVLCIEQSGVRALEELLASRIFLYDKFYYHHKVMAAEELVRTALRALAAVISEFNSPAGLLPFGDDSLIFSTADSLAHRFGISPKTDGLVDAVALLERIRNRDLPRRAFAFARRFIPAPPEIYATLESRGEPDKLNWGNTQFEEITDFLEDAAAKEIYLANLADLSKELGGASRVFIGVQSPRRAAGSLDLPVITRDGHAERQPPFLFEGAKWSNAYALNKQTCYVFADSDFPKVHIAAERLFADRGLTFAPSSWMLAKLETDDLELLRSELPDSEKWLPHRLPPNYLDEPEVTAEIDVLKDKLSSFLKGVDKERGPKLVKTWLWQLPDPDLQETAIDFLKFFTYFEEHDVVEAFENHLAANQELEKAIWIPFRTVGGEGESADQIHYNIKTLKVRTASLPFLTAKDVATANEVVFFDDAVNSGTQSLCRLGSWFGFPDLCINASDADPNGALQADLLAALRSVRISFVYHAAHPAGVDRLMEGAKKIGINARVLSSVDSSGAAYNLAGFDDGSVARKRFSDWLQAKGEYLLGRMKPDWTPEKRKLFARGYGGLGTTISYRHSVSSGVPVALWAFSDDPQDVWVPLLPREPRKLVLSLRDR